MYQLKCANCQAVLAEVETESSAQLNKGSYLCESCGAAEQTVEVIEN